VRIEHKNNILKLAIEYGCRTAKDLAGFLKGVQSQKIYFPLINS